MVSLGELAGKLNCVTNRKENQNMDFTDKNILTAFNNGEWCDTADICRLLNITFEEGFRKFEFSRTAEWNDAPLNGQKITTKFRIKGCDHEAD